MQDYAQRYPQLLLHAFATELPHARELHVPPTTLDDDDDNNSDRNGLLEWIGQGGWGRWTWYIVAAQLMDQQGEDAV